MARLARQAAQRAAEAERLAGLPWRRRVPNGPLGRPDGAPKEMLLLAHLPERVRVWFDKYIDKLRKTETAYKHVSLYVARNGKRKRFDGHQVQLKIGAKLVYLGRTWEPRLGALLAAAAILDPRLTFRLSLLAWILWIYEDDPEGSRFAQWSGTEEVVHKAAEAARAGPSGGGAGPSNADGLSFDMEEASEQELEMQPESFMPFELPMTLDLPMPLELPMADAQQEDAPQAVHAATLAEALELGLSESLALLNQGADAVAATSMSMGMTQEQAAKVLRSVGFDAGAALSSGLELNALVEAYKAQELRAAGVGFDDLREVGAPGVDDLELEEELDLYEELDG